MTNYAYDLSRFLKWSAAAQQTASREHLEAFITMDYHRLEKGLSLPSPRAGFGVEVARSLLANLSVYVDRYGTSSIVFISISVLEAYVRHNQENGFPSVGIDVSLKHLKHILEANQNTAGAAAGGITEVSADSILQQMRADIPGFFASRHSVRDYSSAYVSPEVIKTAVKMALRTPSVCNRQPWRVRCITDARRKHEILRLQNGNRGFGDRAAHVLVITSDLRLFVSPGERNQGWIDGGMFAMSLVYALHGLGLGSCCLNWAVTKEADRKLRTNARIPDQEIIIMLISVGALLPKFRVAQSSRRSVEEILSFDSVSTSDIRPALHEIPCAI